MSKADSFIVTKQEDNYNIIEKNILDKYSMKADMDFKGSKKIKTEEQWIYEDYILEPKYDPAALVKLLDLNTYHEQCVDVVARDAAGLNYTLVPVENEDETAEPPSELTDFFTNISPSINKLLYKMNYDRRSIGYGCLEVIREGKAESPVQTLAHVQAHTLRRAADGFRVQQKVGKEEVWFIIYGQNYNKENEKVDVDADTGKIYPYNSLPPERKANELLWVMDYAPGTNYYGRPKVASVIPVIESDLSRTQYNTAFFRNYGMPAFALTITGDFEDYDVDPEDPTYDPTKTLKYKISQQLKEVMKNPHSAVTILVPSIGDEGNVEVNLQPLSVDVKEASFRLFRADNRDEIIHAHRVDPSRLGIAETGKLNGSNAKVLSDVYKVSTVAPVKTDGEDLINKIIRKEFEVDDWEFSIVDLDPKDFTIEIGTIEKLFNMAAITPNEIIKVVGEKYGLSVSDNPYLDEYYLNGQPLDNIWYNSGTDPETNSILDELEENLVNEADKFDNEYREEGQSNTDGLESAVSQKQDNLFHKIISRAFNRRKEA